MPTCVEKLPGAFYLLGTIEASLSHSLAMRTVFDSAGERPQRGHIVRSEGDLHE